VVPTQYVSIFIPMSTWIESPAVSPSKPWIILVVLKVRKHCQSGRTTDKFFHQFTTARQSHDISNYNFGSRTVARPRLCFLLQYKCLLCNTTGTFLKPLQPTAPLPSTHPPRHPQVYSTTTPAQSTHHDTHPQPTHIVPPPRPSPSPAREMHIRAWDAQLSRC